MTIVFDDIREYAQHHPLSVATILMIFLPGTYFYATGKTFPQETDLHIFPPTLPSVPTSASALSPYRWKKQVDLPPVVLRLSKFIHLKRSRATLLLRHAFMTLKHRRSPRLPYAGSESAKCANALSFNSSFCFASAFNKLLIAYGC